MEDITLEEKLLYIEKFLDHNGENIIMGIKRIGHGAFQIGSQAGMMWTGVGGTYDYIKAFDEMMKKMADNFNENPGLLSQIDDHKEYKKLDIKTIEDIIRKAFFE